MEGLKVWKLSSSIARPLSLRQLFGLGSSSGLVVRCFDGGAATTTTNTNTRLPSRNRQSSTSTSTSDVRAIRLKKVEQLRSKGLDPYAYKWDRSHSAMELQEIYKNLKNGEELDSESHHVSVAGRIVARRAFGKLSFLTLRDHSGTIQVFLFVFCSSFINCIIYSAIVSLLLYFYQMVVAILREGKTFE